VPNIYQNRQGSSYKVTYPDFADFDVQPSYMALLQEVGKQDIVELKYPFFNTFYQEALKTGVPVHIKWSNDKVSSEFFGYVYSVSSDVNQTLNKPFKVKCIGSGMVLKESGKKVWVNKTASDIVTEIANKYKLKPKVTSSSVKFNQQSLVNHTYWEKVQELARRIGYVSQVIGTELHFHPVDKMINQFMTSIPTLFFTTSDINTYMGTLSHTLDLFRPLVGDHADKESYKRRIKTVSGVDPITSMPYTVSASPNLVGKKLRKTTKDPLFNESLTTTISESSSMAKTVVEAHAHLSRFSILAEGIGQGDPRIAPYRTVEIQGTGNVTDGFWVIKKVEHSLTFDGRYSVEFMCMSDGVGSNKSSGFRPDVAGVGVRNVAYELVMGGNVRSTSSRISAVTPMIKNNSAGFKITPRRWVGR